MYKSLQKDIKELMKEYEEKRKKLVEEVERLKAQNISDIEGITNKLRNYAQHAIKISEGPVQHNEHLNFSTKDVFHKRSKETLAFMTKYGKIIDDATKQLSQVYQNLQDHVTYMKKQKELDQKFIKTLEKLEKIIGKEEEKEIKSGTKSMVQSKMKQYFEIKDNSSKQKINCSIGENSSPREVRKSNENKQDIPVKEAKNSSRKRKYKSNDDSSSSQENGIKNIISRLRKRVKLSSSKSDTESSSSSEYMSVQELDEPMSVSSQSSSQAMSVSESYQTDAMSVDESMEKVTRMKSTINGTEKFSKKLKKGAAYDFLKLTFITKTTNYFYV